MYHRYGVWLGGWLLSLSTLLVTLVTIFIGQQQPWHSQPKLKFHFPRSDGSSWLQVCLATGNRRWTAFFLSFLGKTWDWSLEQWTKSIGVCLHIGQNILSLNDQVDSKLLAHVWQLMKLSQLFQLSLRQSSSPAYWIVLGCPFEEVVLKSIVGSDPCLGIVLQHPQDQILEAEIICYTVTGLTQSPSSRASSLHS